MSASERPGVIAKAMLILDAFSVSCPRLSLAQLSARTGLVPSTALRRAQDLVTEGLLDRLPDGRFYIGAKVHRLAAAAPTGAKLSAGALPVMQDIFNATGFEVELTVLDDIHGLVLERFYAAGHHRELLGSSGPLPLHATAAGLVLLAHVDGETRDRALENPLHPVTGQTCVDGERLRAHLGEIRRRGYAVSDRGSNMCTSAVAAPIFAAENRVAAALSLIRGYDGTHPRAMADVARVGARMISRQLIAT